MPKVIWCSSLGWEKGIILLDKIHKKTNQAPDLTHARRVKMWRQKYFFLKLWVLSFISCRLLPLDYGDLKLQDCTLGLCKFQGTKLDGYRVSWVTKCSLGWWMGRWLLQRGPKDMPRRPGQEPKASVDDVIRDSNIRVSGLEGRNSSPHAIMREKVWIGSTLHALNTEIFVSGVGPPSPTFLDYAQDLWHPLTVNDL